MRRRREPWYRNPFRLGSVGLCVLLAGYTLLSAHTAEHETSSLTVLGRLGFLVGVLIVLAAAVIWSLDASKPEPVADEEFDDEEERDDFD